MTPYGDIRDIRHVVILMQENRGFDRYFGTLRGVRGFGDRATILLPGGLPVWQQPDTAPGIDRDRAWSQRFTGHLETGAPSVTG